MRTRIAIAIATALPATAAAALPPLALPPTLSATLDPPAPPLPPATDLDAAVEAAKARFEVVFSAMIANGILRSVGLAARDASPRIALQARDGGDPFAARLAHPPPGEPSLAAIVNPRFGSRDTLAISIAQKLVPTARQSSGLASDIRISHQDGTLDAGFNLSGRQDFTAPDPMALSYDGHALVAVSDGVQLGLTARGQLGSFGALTTSGTEVAGALVRFKLGSERLSVGSDLGYDFGLNPQSEATQRQVHAKINLNIKL